MAQEFRAEFIERVERTKSVVSFRMKPLVRIDFIAGQFVQVLFDESDKANKTVNKYLSFSCAPGKEYFEVTKRISESDFSKRLLVLKKGDNVSLKGPLGHCVLDSAYEKIAFLIGGIGITPVVSMLEHIAENKMKTNACLLYSNMSDDDIAFKPELDTWSRDNANIKVVHTVVNRLRGDKNCFVGMITKDFVIGEVPDFKERDFYLFGPPAMVNAMKVICREIGCDMEKVRAENFTGY